MRILIACEESQTVCKAFRKIGHEAFSCDILSCSGGKPEWHIQDDVLKHLNEGWDMMIAHPPCTYLTVTGARWMYADKTKTKPHPRHLDRKQKQKEAIDFFTQLWKADIPYIAIENPIGIMSTVFMKPTQIIKPCWFGEDANKKTCLWLKNLPPLLPTKIVKVTLMRTKSGKVFDKWFWETSKLKGIERQIVRSKTFPGIADAMAQQWGYLTVGTKAIPPSTKVQGILA